MKTEQLGPYNLSWPEGVFPLGGDALALGELGSGKLDPTIFEQALHVMVPPDCRFGVMIFGTVCLDADS